ncbi:hypothetical protein BCR44DRAFT_1509846 [Catenaria anguillulae PL171]|uniref:Uncharacterized protein n=1 Tax=Catenaria anguillulae PL171 TaxID=765915 RepID=A0A1Y2HYS1_9FUNG|nr:hypothetical protein BCR44DRAFT_1509846 [Catenaria anguillulae PL171]
MGPGSNEQPCAPGLVCSGYGALTCVRNGTGPVWASGSQQYPDQAARSAAETPDDSIPLRPPSASTSTRASTVPTESRARFNDSSTDSSLPHGWPILAIICLGIGVVSGVVCGRVRRSKPRLPTIQDSIPGQDLVVVPPPKPTTGPAASPAPRPSKSSESPIKQLAEHATTTGQTKTVIEVPLQPLTSSNPQAYPPQSPAQMPMPQAHAPPFDSQPDAAVHMPAPQVLSLNGSTLHSQLSSDLPDPPQPSPAQPAQLHPSLSGIQAQSQADQATLSSGPGGVQIEVAAGPGDSELALPGGDQYSTRVQVHGNPEDEELVLPGPTAHAAARE